MRTREKIEIDLVEEFVNTVSAPKMEKTFTAYWGVYLIGVFAIVASIEGYKQYSREMKTEEILITVLLVLNILLFISGFICIGYSYKVRYRCPKKIRLISEVYGYSSIMGYLSNVVDIAIICKWDSGIGLLFMQLILLLTTVTMTIVLMRQKYILPESRGKEKKPVWGPTAGTAIGISALYGAIVPLEAQTIIGVAAAALSMCYPVASWMKVFYAIKYKIKLDDDVPAEDNTPTTNDQV